MLLRMCLALTVVLKVAGAGPAQSSQQHDNSEDNCWVSSGATTPENQEREDIDLGTDQVPTTGDRLREVATLAVQSLQSYEARHQPAPEDGNHRATVTCDDVPIPLDKLPRIDSDEYTHKDDNGAETSEFEYIEWDDTEELVEFHHREFPFSVSWTDRWNREWRVTLWDVTSSATIFFPASGELAWFKHAPEGHRARHNPGRSHIDAKSERKQRHRRAADVDREREHDYRNGSDDREGLDGDTMFVQATFSWKYKENSGIGQFFGSPFEEHGIRINTKSYSEKAIQDNYVKTKRWDTILDTVEKAVGVVKSVVETLNDVKDLVDKFPSGGDNDDAGDHADDATPVETTLRGDAPAMITAGSDDNAGSDESHRAKHHKINGLLNQASSQLQAVKNELTAQRERNTVLRARRAQTNTRRGPVNEPPLQQLYRLTNTEPIFSALRQSTLMQIFIIVIACQLFQHLMMGNRAY